MNRSRILVVLGLIFLSSAFSFGQLKLPAIIGDHMVLQRETAAPLWGWTKPGQEVLIEAEWCSENFTGIANEEGYWKIDVRTPEAGGPYGMVISADETIQLKNILIGEVWLCSGQSNMEMPVQGWDNQPITGSADHIAAANFPDIRLFTVQRKVAYEPMKDCKGEWTPCSPESVADFSATGYFFGLKLYKELNIPVGLIHSSWGGTPAEAWTNQEYINTIPYFHTSKGKNDPKEFTARKVKAHASVQQEWLTSLGFVVPEEAPAWTLPNFNDEEWINITVPSNWNETQIDRFDGVVNLRFEVNIPSNWRKKTCILELGPIDEMDLTWVNGTLVGKHMNVYDWGTERKYEIPVGVLKKGTNVIAVKVANTSGLGGINGQPDQLKLYPKDDGSIYTPLDGNWKAIKSMPYESVAPMPWCNNCGEPHTPTTLYNGMIAPLIPFAIKGAIWYQGESNRYDGELYKTLFPTMITNWRQDWKQGDFPFYFVQIAPYTYRDEFSTGLLKEAQAFSQHLPNTGMVVTSDIGSLTTIHPPDKKSVGDRLASWALAKDYDLKDVAYKAPAYKAYKIEDNEIRIFFSSACAGFTTDGKELKHFQIAGKDKKFYPAQARIDGNTVVVSSDKVAKPYAVKFGWGHTDETNLFGKNGLPVGPFRTRGR